MMAQQNSAQDQIFSRLKVYVLDKLHRELSPKLLYHNIAHTIEDVLPRVEYMANKYNLSSDEQFVLRVAALFHDTGYTNQYRNNEPIGAQIAECELKKHHVNNDIINTVTQLILVTAMPQQPNNILEKIICDADLDSLGRKDYFYTSLCLHSEMEYFLEPIPIKLWWEGQVKFLKSHAYFTEVSELDRAPLKEMNISLIDKMMI